MPIAAIKTETEEPPEGKSASGAGSKSRTNRTVRLAIGLAAILVVGVGAFFVVQKLKPVPPAVPPVVKAKAPAAPVTAATVPPGKTPAAPNASSPTPSDTLNKMAHVPANAINKAQDAITARRASGQTRVDAAAAGEDLADKPAAAAPGGKAGSSQTKTSTTMRSVAPGLSAATELDAAVEASPAFRSFVANTKVSGVFQGSPSRAVINGRLARAGETVDGALGIVFDSVDTERRQLVFKDKTGATVARKY